MSNKNPSKTTTPTSKINATLRNGNTYTLLVPNPENPMQPGKIEFFKGVSVQIDQATKEHLEKNAVFFKTAHFPDGEVEQSTHCCFEFSPMNADEMANGAEPVT